MAKTITWGEILNMAAPHVPRPIEAERGSKICNIATDFIWRQYDWRESLSDLPPFYLTPLTQDHGAPAVTIPSDFLGLREATLMHIFAAPTNNKWDLKVTKDLKDTQVVQLPHAIAFRPHRRVWGTSTSTSGVFRVFPRVPENVGCPEWCINGTYKTRTTALTPANYTDTVIPFDDMYLMELSQVVRWVMMDLAGDPRAGTLSYQGNTVTNAQGEAAKAALAVKNMANAEGLELGDPVIAPREPLVDMSHTYGYGLIL